MLKAVIFDLDGTLVKSKLDFHAMRQEVACPADRDILSYLNELSGKALSQAQAIIAQHEARDAEQTKALDGVPLMLAELGRLGVRTGIVTRNSRAASKLKMALCGIDISEVLTREDAPAKPKPDALLALSGRWQLRPQDCAYVGDYLYDLQAARNAEMLACLYAPECDLPPYADQADFVFNSWHRFIPELRQHLAP